MHLLDTVVGRRAAIAIALALGLLALLAAASPRTHGRVVVTDTTTTILDVIEFAPGTATLRAKSLPTVDAVAETMKGNPSIELVEVQAHMRSDVDADAGLRLSQRRAEVIVDYLVNAGVARSRLVARGYGQTQPLDPLVPANNERVAFLILKRAGELSAR